MNRKNGFTVAEILMTLLLLVAVGAVLVVPVQHLAGQLAVRPLETVVLTAVRDAHYLARFHNENVFLVNVAESNLLQIAAQDGLVLADIAYASAEGERATSIRFHRVLPEDPNRTGEDFTWDDQPVQAVLFTPCGVSVPFAVHLAEDGNARLLVMDPFSSDVRRSEEVL